MKNLSWTPKLVGDTYCSSGCGAGCKHKDYLKAVKQADALCRKIGNGFVPDVYENLGWHYSVSSPNNCLEVTHAKTKYDKNYHAYLNVVPNSGGRWIATAPTPQEAINKVIEAANKEFRQIKNLLESMPNIIHEKISCKSKFNNLGRLAKIDLTPKERDIMFKLNSSLSQEIKCTIFKHAGKVCCRATIDDQKINGKMFNSLVDKLHIKCTIVKGDTSYYEENV